MLSKLFTSLLSYFIFLHTAASLLLPRNDDASGHNWIDHDKVIPFTQSASAEFEGQIELRFNPYLHISGGCDLYPAVDASGNLGAGLKPTGGGRDGCDDSKGSQVYVRRGESQGRIGVLYSYYVPKVRWDEGDNNGHRHYWASVVVWINRWGCETDDITALWPVGVSYTTDHLSWGSAAAGSVSFKSSDVGINMATHPKMQIHDNTFSPFPGADGDSVFEPTLISWDSLPDAAKEALTDVKYEKTQVPFTDDNFQAHLDAAYREDFYGGLPTEPDCHTEEPPAKTDTPDDPPMPATSATQANPTAL